MNYIYVDNYRGFSKTLIPINSVNFLVGENSTGKTSILGLIKLLAPTDIWIANELDFRKVGFGTFKDVVSIDSKNKTHFSVGLAFDKPDANSKFEAVFMTFSEHEGMPKLSSLTSYRNGFEVKIKYVGKTIKYKYRKIEEIESAKEFASIEFNNLVESQKNDNNGFTILKEDNFFFSSAPPIVVLSQIEALIFSDKKTEKRNQFGISSFLGEITWLAPIRSKPRKTYDEFSLEYSPEGNHTPYLIKKKLDSKQDASKFRKFLNAVGKDSGLFKSIEIKNYGRGTAAPFELDIVLGKHRLSVSSVGYGVSQSLPVIVEIFSRPENSWLAIQQPEVHLHPRAQATLGEVFFNMSALEGKKFVVETHSDYTIDRFRISLKNSKKKIKSQILFFEKTDNGNKLTPIEIDHNGDLDIDQPKSYRDFFLKEEMTLLGL